VAGTEATLVLTFDDACGGIGERIVAVDVQVVDKLTLSNGIGWSPDGSVPYLIDTGNCTLWAFDYDLGDGSLHAARRLVETAESQGNQAGLAVDSAGGLWVAMHWSGRIHRYAPNGTWEEVVTAPSRAHRVSGSGVLR
jgi:sugar lactone lactonase YvrE